MVGVDAFSFSDRAEDVDFLSKAPMLSGESDVIFDSRIYRLSSLPPRVTKQVPGSSILICGGCQEEVLSWLVTLLRVLIEGQRQHIATPGQHLEVHG